MQVNTIRYKMCQPHSFNRVLLMILLITVSISIAKAQTLTVGQTGLEESLRQLNLLNKLPNSGSLSVRPIYHHQLRQKKVIESLFLDTNNLFVQSKQKAFEFEWMPLSINNTFNSHRPFGWNDAGMRMARGYQLGISAGFFAKAGPLSLQIMPEWYHIQNSDFETTPQYGQSGLRPMNKAYIGQSSIRLNVGVASLGISTENLWWGPGQFSSLTMSNHAPGFTHITFNSRKPFKTFLGSFEWQLLVGELTEDSGLIYENRFQRSISVRENSRYLNAVVITYQPKWLKNIYLGLTRYEQLYRSGQQAREGSWLKRHLPVLTFETSDENASGVTRNDGAVSLFGRWVLPSAHAEFYFEYGYNDFKKNMRDLTISTNHASAYLAGFKKIIPKANNTFLDISGEMVHMAQNPSYIIRNAGNWYIHSPIRQGYTHQNQIIGAGSGFGNNVQTLQLKRVRALNHIGIKLQRIQQDPKGVIQTSLATIGMRQWQWTDFDLGLLYQHKWNNFIVQSEIHGVYAKNYGWEPLNRFNFFMRLNAIYFFK